MIIGCGLTGLVLAHKLTGKGKDVLVLEKAARPGGVIETVRSGRFVYEKGPNTGVVKYGEVAELFEELSGYFRMEIADKAVKNRYIWKKGRWRRLPLSPVGGITTSLFTWKDKFRLLGELFRRPGDDPEETLDRMVRRRMGESFLNYAVDPFIIGVYAGDPAKIVPKYALPKLYNLEQNYGSFIGGALKKKFEEKDEMEKKATRDIFSAEGGLGNFIRALSESVKDSRIIYNSEDVTVIPEEIGFNVTFRRRGEECSIRSGKVISTAGSYEIPGIFPFIRRELLTSIDNLKYAKVVQVALGFEKWKGIPLNGFGGLVPYIEGRDILGAMFMSSFLRGRAPEEGALLSVFLGGVRREDIYNRDDSEIEIILNREISEMFELGEFNPELLKIMRYDRAIPQYGVESRARFEAIRLVEDKYPGLRIAGNLEGGIGMADRIKQAWDLSGDI